MTKGTILVNLERDWFAPDGSLYQRVDNPHQFPAEWKDQIPRVHKVVRDLGAKPVKREVDKEAAARIFIDNPKIVETIQLTGSGDAVVVATAVEGDVKSVGNTVDETTKGPHDHNKTHQSTPVKDAVKAAEESGAQVGGKPRESGPLPAGGKK